MCDFVIEYLGKLVLFRLRLNLIVFFFFISFIFYLISFLFISLSKLCTIPPDEN